jgi:WLM domain
MVFMYRDKYYSYFNSSITKSNTDGNYYPVLSEFDNQQEAADMIGNLNQFSIRVLTRLKEKYLTITPVTPDQVKGYEAASILSRNYSPASLQENDPPSPKETSYNQNKGRVISLCIREKESGKNELHDPAVVKFVMLHELAHTITPELTHSNLFWTNFRFLLEFCQIEGLYIAPNYNSVPAKYCGMEINYNPIYDSVRTVSYFYPEAKFVD